MAQNGADLMGGSSILNDLVLNFSASVTQNGAWDPLLSFPSPTSALGSAPALGTALAPGPSPSTGKPLPCAVPASPDLATPTSHTSSLGTRSEADRKAAILVTKGPEHQALPARLSSCAHASRSLSSPEEGSDSSDSDSDSGDHWTEGFKNSPTLFGEQLAKDLEAWEAPLEEGRLLQYVDDLLIATQTRDMCGMDRDCLGNISTRPGPVSIGKNTQSRTDWMRCFIESSGSRESLRPRSWLSPTFKM
ncbi:hypothetical protein HGM15179_018350, partial [Zosterops borbonicus]